MAGATTNVMFDRQLSLHNRLPPKVSIQAATASNGTIGRCRHSISQPIFFRDGVYSAIKWAVRTASANAGLKELAL